MIQIGLRFFQRPFLDLHVRLRLMKIGHGLIEIRLRGILFRDERLGARGIQAREFERRLRIVQVPLGLIDVRLKNHGIDLRDHLARFHDRVKIGEEFLNVSRDLTSHLNVLHGVQGSRRRDRLRDRPTSDSDRLETLPGTAPAFAKQQRSKHQHDESNDERERSFQHLGTTR